MAYSTPGPTRPPHQPLPQGSLSSTSAATPSTQSSSSQPHSTSAPSIHSMSAPSVLAGSSPLDWSHFMSFNTPGIDGGNIAPTPPAPMQSHGPPPLAMPDSTSDYKQFAQSIAMQPPPPVVYHPFPYGPSQPQQRPPPPHSPSYQQPAQPQPQPQPPHSQTTPKATVPGYSNRSTRDKGKGPAMGEVQAASSSASRHDVKVNRPVIVDESGLSLDPSAFSRDIRFQVPPFLWGQVAGAPTFPPGGEAWSGFVDASVLSLGEDAHVQTFVQGSGPGQPPSPYGYVYGPEAGIPQNPSGYGALRSQEAVGSSARIDYIDQTSGMSGYNTSTTTYFPNHSHQTHPSAGLHPGGRKNSSDSQLPIARPLFEIGSTRPSIPSGHEPYVSAQPIAPTLSPPTATTYSGQGEFVTTTTPSSATSPLFPSSNSSTVQAPYGGPTSGLPQPAIGPTVAEGPGLYSTTGFDMLGVLSRVANRKEQRTVLGPVDFSCSFVVVDVRRFDAPIVYASPTFSALTGYDMSQIVGRNCRFLQSPEGDVVKGSKRKYTDNVAVAHLKRMLNASKECQASLINYRRGGIPFINLVTVVPIPWDGTDIVYHVGFQVDLVEQPNAILRNMRDGSYQVNYTVANPPQPPLPRAGRPTATSTGLSQEILDIMGLRVQAPGFGMGDDGGKMEWLKMVIENADDFIHVLSLKGSFQYVSPSVRRVLEYDPEDLVNKNVADFCHPSDIVPLMRELKDSTHPPAEGQAARTVTLVFRIRRKNSGYIWVQSVGRLHVEPGKGRKAVILSGRPRTMPMLRWQRVAEHGGLGEHEFWTRLSLEGLILHSTMTVSDVIGHTAADILGQSFFSLLPGGYDGLPDPAVIRADPSAPIAVFATALQTVTAQHSPKPSISISHKILTKSGLQLDVVSVLYAHLSPLKSDMSGQDLIAESPVSDVSTSSSVFNSQPHFLLVQTRLVTQSPSDHLAVSQTQFSARPALRPLVHSPKANIFEELETTRGTSWQYELHQLRLVNRRLRDEIAAARRARAAGNIVDPPSTIESGSTAVASSTDTAPLTGSSVGPPSHKGRPSRGGDEAESDLDRFSAAPRHQLAPGFGLVPPGVQGYY